MYKAICIKRYKNFNKGDMIKVAYSFGDKIYYLKGFKVGYNLSREEFETYFLSFNNYFIVAKPDLKRRFRKPKPQQLKVVFNNISEKALKELYNNVFSYIELSRQIDPGLIISFNYSIVSTLEKLQSLYTVLSEEKFIEAVRSSEQVFRGLYKTALGIDISSEATSKNYEKVLKQFQQDSDILGSFFEELNKGE